MAGVKTSAVQEKEPSIYVVYDSSLPNASYEDDILNRSISRARTKFIGVALNDLKGLMFSGSRLRILYCESGFDGNTADTVKLEFSAVYNTGMGKVKDNLVSVTRQPEGGRVENQD